MNVLSSVQAIGCRAPSARAACASRVTAAARHVGPLGRRAQLQRCQGSLADEGQGTQAESSFPDEETTFYEGNGSAAELAVSCVLGITLIYLPLTLASIGRRLWVSYKFTDRRLIVTTASPVFQRAVEVPYSKIKEVRSVGRGLGLWGDMVVFLKDGSRLELVGLERHDELRNYLEGKIDA